VAFPDLGALQAPAGPHAPRDIMISGDDLPRIGSRIEEILVNAGPSGRSSFDASQADEIQRFLAPSWQVRAPLAVAAREADRTILTLTEDQFRVLDQLSRLRRVAISGPAGSGKSLLAVEQARRLAAQGLRTLFVCFNRPLADAVSAGLDADSPLAVHTFHGLCHRLGEEAGVVDGEHVDEPSPEFFSQLPDVLLETLHLRPDLRFDAIIVDEGQDFEAEWWALLELALRDPEVGILYVFHDDEQRLATGESSLPEGLVPIDLSRNIRNTQAIHAFASRLRSAPSAADGPEGRSVELVELDTPDRLLTVLSRVLHRLIHDEQFRPEEIAVLTGRGRATTALAGVERIGAYRCGELPVLPNVVAVDTIRRFKGLDCRVAILVEVDHLADQHGLLYVGATRARTHLVIIAGSALLSSLLEPVRTG